MRQILFRGKCKVTGNFVYGDLIHGVATHKGKFYILPQKQNLAYVPNCDPLNGVEVIPETVGQYIGLNDINGTKIFEGDIFKGEEEGEFYLITWNNKGAIFQIDLYGYNIYYGEGNQEIVDNEISLVDENCFELSILYKDKIIGNIYE